MYIICIYIDIPVLSFACSSCIFIWATKKTSHINFYQRVDLECPRERKMLVRERSRKQKCSAKVAKDGIYVYVRKSRCQIVDLIRKLCERLAKVARKLRCPKSRGVPPFMKYTYKRQIHKVMNLARKQKWTRAAAHKNASPPKAKQYPSGPRYMRYAYPFPRERFAKEFV